MAPAVVCCGCPSRPKDFSGVIPNMDAPKCRLCGGSGWQHVCGERVGERVVIAGSRVGKSIPNSVPNVSIAPNKSMAYLRTKLWREANPDRYREQQRELMRRRRERKRIRELEGSGGVREVKE